MSGLAEKMVVANFVADGLENAGTLSLQGSQMFVLLENLVREDHWDKKSFYLDWVGAMKHYSGLTDGATRFALAGAEEGKEPGEVATLQEDIGPVSRLSPLVWAFQEDEETLQISVREYVGLTHRAAVVQDAAQIFARTAYNMLAGEELIPALQALCEHRAECRAAQLIRAGMETAHLPTGEALRQFGPAGSADQALPLVGHLLVRYDQDPREGHRQNLEAGGDVSSRAGVLGMLFGASLGLGSLESQWVLQTEHLERVQDFLGWGESLADFYRV